jgi:hypothetical protein
MVSFASGTLSIPWTSKKIDSLMAHTACLVCLVSTVSGLSKNALGRGNASNGHITKLEQSRYLWSMNTFGFHSLPYSKIDRSFWIDKHVVILDFNGLASFLLSVIWLIVIILNVIFLSCTLFKILTPCVQIKTLISTGDVNCSRSCILAEFYNFIVNKLPTLVLVS